MKTAVIYARVSTRRQAQEELPLEGQIDQCRRKAAALEARVVRTFVDEGISGRIDKRPQFRASVDYCELHDVDLFITWSTSRFARNKLDAGVYKLRLAKSGTKIVYVSMNIDPSTDAGWMTEGVLELFDEMYSRQLAADTMRSMIRNAEAGYWCGGRPPYGYEIVPAEDNPARRQLRPNPAEATLVRRIFDLRVEGLGAKSIAVLLNESREHNRGRAWNKGTVSALLRNETMIGNIVFGRKDRRSGLRPRDEWVIVRSHAPVVDLEIWQSVQETMNSQATSSDHGCTRSRHLFTGMLKCGTCRASMQIETAKGRHKTYSYYGCRRRQKHAACEMRRLRADIVDDFLVGTICARIFTRENLISVVKDIHEGAGKWARDHRRRIEELGSAIRAVEKRQEPIWRLLETHGPDTPHLGDVTKRLRKTNEELKLLERRLAETEAEVLPQCDVTEADVDELRTFLLDTIQSAENPAKVRAFFGTFIERIDVLDDSVEITYRPDVLVKKEALSLPPVHRGVASVGNWLPGTPPLRTVLLSVSLPERLRKKAA